MHEIFYKYTLIIIIFYFFIIFFFQDHTTTFYSSLESVQDFCRLKTVACSFGDAYSGSYHL